MLLNYIIIISIIFRLKYTMFLIPNIYKIEYTFPLIFFFVDVDQISILYYTNRSSNDPKIFVYFFFERCSHDRLFHTMSRKIHRKAFHLININNAWRHLSYRISAWCATAMAFTLYHLVDIDVTTTVNFRFVLPFGEVLTRKWRQQDSKTNWFRINFQITS